MHAAITPSHSYMPRLLDSFPEMKISRSLLSHQNFKSDFEFVIQFREDGKNKSYFHNRNFFVEMQEKRSKVISYSSNRMMIGYRLITTK